MNKSFVLSLVLTLGLVACTSAQDSNPTSKINREGSYFYFRSQFKSSIINRFKAPQSYTDFNSAPINILVKQYVSEGRSLKGLLQTDNLDSTKRTKAVVYLHGGFSLGYSDISDCQPFIDAGYIVFAPTYRGENGNNGNFECFFGEVTDAENAVKWLSKQSYIDSNNIYVFGHSIGGGMSTLLSLNNNCPSKLNGSSSGLYFKEQLEQMSDKVPFDKSNDKEYLFRCPVYMLNYLPQKHLMYMGKDDNYDLINSSLKELYESEPENFKLIPMPGNHFTSLKPSMEKFIKVIEEIQ